MESFILVNQIFFMQLTKRYKKIKGDLMKWKYEKFKGDMAIYAICPKCNFHHSSSVYNPHSGESVVQNPYTFCPLCGEFLFENYEEVNVIWNERNIFKLYEEEVDVTLIHQIRKERLGEINDIKQSD